MNSLIIMIAFIGLAAGHGHFGGSSSNEEHFGKNCTVAPTGTTNCTGVTGHNCSDSAYLATLLPGTSSVLICKGKSPVPKNATIEVELGRDLDDCRRSCRCFTVQASETRNCTALNADTTFVKNACNNQTTLIPLLAAGTTVKVCVYRRNHLSFEGSVPIFATLEEKHGHGK